MPKTEADNGNAGPLAQALTKRGWKTLDFDMDDGSKVPIVIRRVSPRLYIEIAGSAFADIATEGGDELREPKPAELARQFEALERLIRAALVTEVGSHTPALDDQSAGLFSTDEVSRLSDEILAFSGLTEDTKKAARRFRKKP